MGDYLDMIESDHLSEWNDPDYLDLLDDARADSAFTGSTPRRKQGPWEAATAKARKIRQAEWCAARDRAEALKLLPTPE